jgi:hypothetical protein
LCRAIILYDFSFNYELLKRKTMRLFLTFLLVFFVTVSTQAQSIKNSIEGSDFWGAWMIKGSTKAWIVDGIPERVRLWDFDKNEVILSTELKANPKDINVLSDGSLAYISHNVRNEYIIIGQDGSQSLKKFSQNAPSYYIHADGKYFFGSTFEGFFTYTIKGNKITKSKLNETITGYSSKYYNTNSPNIFFRSAKDIYQKIEIGEEGELISNRALDKNTFLMNDVRDEILLISPSTFRYYELPSMAVKSSVIIKEPFEYTSAVYDSNNSMLYYAGERSITKYDLNTQKSTNSISTGADDLHFEDRLGNIAIAFSDDTGKFYAVQL